MAISYSETQCFKTCRKMHDWQYKRGLRPIDKAEALFFGTAIHSALELIYRDFPLDVALAALDELDDVNRAKARAMITRYHERYFVDEDAPAVVDVEKWLKCSFGPHEYIGRADAIIEREDGLWIVEHKTAASVDDGYMQRVKIDTQSMLYVIAAQIEYGRPVAGVIYDVLVKPAIRLKKTEAIEDFEARCLEDVGAEDFVRVEMRFDEDDLTEAECEFIVCCQDMAGCDIPYKNTGACNAIGRQCPFLCLCCEKDECARAKLIEERFTQKEK